jgi:YqaJ-like viral recombinase domain
MEQRTPQWWHDKEGMFSASEFHKLMSGGRREMTPNELAAEIANKGKRKTIDTLFGDTALTYIKDKISEIITNGTCLDYTRFETKATDWGNAWEDEAKQAYSAKIGNLIESIGFVKIDDRCGASPDGFISLGLIEQKSLIIEIKCPYRTTNHVGNLLIKTQAQFKQERPNYYVQIQVQLLATGLDSCDFISYDPRCSDLTKLKIIRIGRDEEMIKEIEYRKDEAKKILSTYMSEIIQLQTA